MATSGGPNIVTDGLVLHLDAGSTKSYPGSGTTWYDLSGNGNNGTLINDSSFSTEKNGSVELDGTDSYITGNITAESFLSDFSISSWFKRNSQSTWDAIFSNNIESVSWDNTTKEATILTFRGSGGSPEFPDYTSIGINLTGTSANGVYLDLGADHYGKWIYVTLTRVGTTISIYAYKDGTLLYSSGTYPYTIQTFDKYMLGRHWYNSGNTTSQILNGSISQVTVHTKALSQLEFEQNYNATKSRFNL